MEWSRSCEKTLAQLGLALSVSVIAACGGSDQSTQATVPGSERALNDQLMLTAAGVKGPLALASVSLYRLDTTLPGYYDPRAPLVTGRTDQAAHASVLQVPRGETPPFVLVVDGRDGIDLNSGKAPVIGKLVTIVTEEMAGAGRPLYATPLTTLAYAMAEDSAGIAAGHTQVVAELKEAAQKIVAHLGFGLPAQVDILTDPPMLDEGTATAEGQLAVAHHRAVVEAVAAIAHEIGTGAGVSADTVLAQLAKDLASDGVIDDSADGRTLNIIDLEVVSRDPSQLTVPDTTLHVTDVATLLSNDLNRQGTAVEIKFVESDITLTRASTGTTQGGTTLQPTTEPTEVTGSTSTTVTSGNTQGTVPVAGPARVLNRQEWTLRYVDSQELVREDGAGVNAFDGDPATVWRSQWSSNQTNLPHEIQIDTGTVAELSGLKYLPPQDAAGYGRVKDFQIYVSDDGVSWGNAVITDAFANSYAEQAVEFPAVLGRYVRFVALSEATGKQYAAAAEITLLGTPLPGNRPPAGTIDTPAADLTVDLGEPVQFAASGYDIDGDSLNYRWDFGTSGLAPAKTQDPGVVRFTAPGEHIITLAVADSTGNLDATPAKRKITVVDRRVPSSNWTLAYVDSEETARSDGQARNAFDGDPQTMWHTQWSTKPAPTLPHEIHLDLGATYDIDMLRYSPRQDEYTSGMVKDFAIYVSDDGSTWGDAAASGSFPAGSSPTSVRLEEGVQARFVRFVALSEQEGKPYSSIAELEIMGARPTRNLAPVARIDSPATDVIISAGQSVAFAGIASDAENDAINYAWDFGASGVAQSTARVPGPITFSQPGTYLVSLSVTDARGNRDTTPAARTITVVASTPTTTTTTVASTTTTSTRASTSTTTSTTAQTTTTSAATTSTTQTLRPVDPLSTADDPVDWSELVGNATGSMYFVASEAEFNNAAAIAQAGDVVIIKNGTYAGWRLKIPSSGTATNPVVYTAQTPGGVTFTGRHQDGIVITGDHNIVGGFVFRQCGAYFVRIIGSSYNRFTDSQLLSCGGGDTDRIVEIKRLAHHNRLDHLLLDDIQSNGLTVLLDNFDVANGPSRYTRIDHNVFQNSVAGASNGREAIQIGQGTGWAGGKGTDALETFTQVDNNLFSKMTREVIEIKSSRNFVLRNRFFDVAGGLSIRNGNYNVVDGNFLQRSRSGINIKGEYQTVINNVVVDTYDGFGLQITAYGKVELLNGRVGEFPPTGNNLFAHNTFVNNKKGGIDVGRPAGYVGLIRAETPPFNNRFINNLIVGSEGTLVNIISATGTIQTNNLLYATGAANVGTAGKNAILADPKLRAGTVEPDGSSPARNKGVALQEVATDRVNRARDDQPDLGAYEYQP